MDPNSRYLVARSLMADRIAEAQRARLLKGDRFERHDEVRRPGSHAGPPILARLLTIRLRLAAHRPSIAAAARGM